MLTLLGAGPGSASAAVAEPSLTVPGAQEATEGAAAADITGISISYAGVGDLDLEVVSALRGISIFGPGSGSLASHNGALGAGNSFLNYADTCGQDTLTFRIRRTGQVAWADEEEIDVTVRPAAPTGLTSPGTTSSSIDLTWTDNSGGEDGYEVQRAVAGSGNWSTFETTAANATGTTVTSLSSDTEYDLRVRAVKGALFSEWATTNASTGPAE